MNASWAPRAAYRQAANVSLRLRGGTNVASTWRTIVAPRITQRARTLVFCGRIALRHDDNHGYVIGDDQAIDAVDQAAGQPLVLEVPPLYAQFLVEPSAP